MIKECAICDVVITKENDTKEHVIPNAIGGRKKLQGFICNECNNKAGSAWESELANQLNPLSLFFDIRREKGNVKSQLFETTGGNKILLNAGGKLNPEKPQCIETPLESGMNIQITAPTMKKARKMLKGIKRKYPEIDIDQLVKTSENNESYCSDKIQLSLSFGGHDVGRSIVKSTLALAVESGIDPKTCDHARTYLLGNDSKACFGFYYERDLISNRPKGIPLHCVYVQGNPITKHIFGYVELFGVHRMVMCLSSSYIGDSFTNLYAVNPVDGKELDLTIDLDLSLEDIEAAYNYEKFPDGALEKAFSDVIKERQKSSAMKEMDRVIDKAVNYAFYNCGAKEGEVLTPEQHAKMLSLINEKMRPWIKHQIL